MKHHRILLILAILFCLGIQLAYGQRISMGGKLQTLTEVDSLLRPQNVPKNHLHKDFLAKFGKEKGRLSLDLQIDLLRLSHLKPVQTDSFNAEYPAVLLRKRTQFQLRLGLVLYLKNKKRNKRRSS